MKYQEKKTSLQVFEDFKISEIISSQVINSNCSNPYAIKIDLVGFSQTATKGIAERQRQYSVSLHHNL